MIIVVCSRCWRIFAVASEVRRATWTAVPGQPMAEDGGRDHDQGVTAVARSGYAQPSGGVFAPKLWSTRTAPLTYTNVV